MKKWLTVKDAASYLGVSTKFIRAMIREDGLPVYQMRKLLFIKRAELDALIEEAKI